MKKDNIRDYATEAFRYYALYKEDKVAVTCEGAQKDIKAVELTLEGLAHHRDINAVRVVKIVYMASPDKRLRRGDISRRVVRAAGECYMSEKKVYTILADARKLFACTRGLRT